MSLWPVFTGRGSIIDPLAGGYYEPMTTRYKLKHIPLEQLKWSLLTNDFKVTLQKVIYIGYV